MRNFKTLILSSFLTLIFVSAVQAMYETIDKRLAEIATTLNNTVKYPVFTQGGPEDIAYNNGNEMLKVFDKNGIKYESSEMPGGHSWTVWRNDLKNFAPRLFK